MLKLDLSVLLDSIKRNELCQNVVSCLDFSHPPNYTELADAVKESSQQNKTKQETKQ